MDEEETEMLEYAFTGNAVHNIDPKGRIVMPSKYRDLFGSSGYALLSPDGCIRVYPEREYLKMLSKLVKGNVRKLALRRRISGSSEPIKVDSQGRMLIPEEMRRAVGITDKVTVVGMIQWLELWEEEAFRKADEELTDEEAIEMMEDLDMS